MLSNFHGGAVRTRSLLAVGAAAAVLGFAGCGGGSSSSGSAPANPNAPEVNAAGDIPDNQAFVAYSPPGAHFSVKVPEGWSQKRSGGAVVFTDKLNAIRIESTAAGGPLSAAQAKRVELPKLGRSVKGFQAGSVTTVRRNAGTAVEVKYLADAAPNAVTGKAGQDAVERYVFFHRGQRVVLTLSGPKGADNVDPWRIVTDSLRWTA
jgi:hypothetical protein